jgi:hypothetical protein
MQRKFSDWGGNIAAFLLVVVVNALANTLPIAGQTTGEVSARYASPFTPAGFTFSIWLVIYVALGAFVIYQALPAQRGNADLAVVSRPFVLGCLANAAWIFAWHYDLLFLSLALMTTLLLTLLVIYRRLHIAEAWATTSQRLFAQGPFSLYAAWIMVATLANISAVQAARGWSDLWLDAVNWTLVKLALAASIGATFALRRGDILFPLVIAWAAIGIMVAQASTPAVAGAAATVALISAILAASEAGRKY